MPIQSRYSNEEFNALSQEVFLTLEKNKAKGDLSIMVLGNVLSSIFKNQLREEVREEMIDQFCKALKKSATS